MSPGQEGRRGRRADWPRPEAGPTAPEDAAVPTTGSGGPTRRTPHRSRPGPAAWPLEPLHLPKVRSQFADFP